ncbi:hypothetical protein K438DRAFT_2021717 [Mycena galopus ATCC 62051]|nr:hypothetical protein K438DRAFT_2021717 [Mycena galopus ATCC 62051]
MMLPQMPEYPRTHSAPAPSPTSAPIHRLPIESLVEIFGIHSTPAFWVAHSSPVHSTELERLANVRLLTFSQVCSQWHSIVIGTPSFWTSLHLNSVLWDTPSHLATSLRLIDSVLERGRDFPLTFMISGRNHNLPPPLPIFHLLARHSHRWYAPIFVCSLEGVDLSVLRGRLPIMTRLELDVPHTSSPQNLEVLDAATSLKTLAISPAWFHELNATTLNRIEAFGCHQTSPQLIARVIALLPKLKAITRFDIAFHVDRRTHSVHRSIVLQIVPHAVQTITYFACNLFRPFHPRHCHEILDNIFASLTLPKLQTLALTAVQYPRCVMEWPDQFLGLAERSGSGKTLTTLKISHVRITDDGLIRVLHALPELEHLEIADHRCVDRLGVDSLLITDDLLRALVSAGLAPRLRHFVCASRLKFTHTLFLDFVTSRLEPFPSHPMCVEICPLMEDDGRLDPAVHSHLQKLALRERQLIYVFSDARFTPSCYAPCKTFYPAEFAAAAA